MLPRTWASTDWRSIEDWRSMVFNRFFFLTLIRSLLLVGTVVVMSSIFGRVELFFTQIILGGIILFQIWELTRFVNKTNEELSRFLAGVKDGDFQLHYPKKEKTSFQRLQKSFGELVETLQSLEAGREAQNQFLNELINQIRFGIIVFDHQGYIEVMNQTASNLTGLPKITKWRNLQNPNKRFLEMLLTLPPTQNQLIETPIGDTNRYFTVSVTLIKVLEREMRLVSFQDIRGEIRQKEIDAWHRLIRILTHETMNSVTPIVSLAETITMLIQNEEGELKTPKEVTDENLSDIHLSLETIIGRGQGILKFVQQYRKLTRVPKPEMQEIKISSLVEKTFRLMEGELGKRSIKWSMALGDFSIQLDPALIEQVLVNLIKNAIEALTDHTAPTIKATAWEEADHVCVSIKDNGPGIPENRKEKIFVPFYTTKPEGSGIGLSLCRQIMNLHGGHLEVQSVPHQSTSFTLVFSQ
ncbi:MAG: ATP-binding protein [Bacteroidota bacterium]